MTTIPDERPSLRNICLTEMPAVRRALHSIQDVDTMLLTLTPNFIEALRQVGPKRRSKRFGVAIGAMMIVVVAALAMVPGVRSFAALAVAAFSTQKALPVAPSGPVPALDATAVVVPATIGQAATLEIPPIEVASTAPTFSSVARAPAKKAPASKGRSPKHSTAHGS